MQISRTPLSCSLGRKVYETQPIGGAFNPVRSPASTPHHPTASAFLFLYILCLRSCRLPSVFIRRPCLPSLPEELRNSWVPSLPGSYPSSSSLQLLVMSLPPCCPYHPAGVSCRLGQPATCHAAFAPKEGARPPDLYFVSRTHLSPAPSSLSRSAV